MSIASATKQRWDACDFQNTIAQLRLGKRNMPPQTSANQGVQGSSPAAALLPRAEMSFSDSDQMMDTAALNLQEQFVFIDLWQKANNVATLTFDMNRIRDKFNNSHQAVANQFSMGGSDEVQYVGFIGHRHELLDNEVVHSETCLVVRFSFANALPA